MRCSVVVLAVLLSASARADDEEEPVVGSAVAAKLRVAPAPAGPAVAADQVRKGAARARLSDAPADLVLLYGSEQEGELGTCGCAENPRGSLARVDRYRTVLERDTDAPVLLLNAGGFLSTVPGEDGELRPDVVIRDRYVVDAFAAGGWDVANLGFRDLPYLARSGLPVGVSANVDGPGVRTHELLEVNGLRVAVTGVTTEGMRHMQVDGFTFDDPVERLRALVPTLEADVVVVLAYDVGQLAPKLARVPGVDVLIEAGGYEGRYDPLVEGEAIWVRSRARTEQLGELRLVVEDGRVTAALDRKIDMDLAIRPTARVSRLERRADREADAKVREMYAELYD